MERERVHDLQALNKQPVFWCGKTPEILEYHPTRQLAR
jgi:hypothetical protein